jgi:subtilisin family serine protease
MMDQYDVADDGPIVELPPDLVVQDRVYAFSPRLWHWTPELAERVKSMATGKTIRIAVGDTGYTKHVDGPEPVAARSFISGQSIVDGNGHGTHCIGTALGRNGIGVAPDAELIVFKCLSNQGSGSSSGIAAGIRWAADQGADIISLSLGGPSSYGPTNEAIDYAFSKGCIVNSAAGNAGYNGSNTIGWPAKHTGSLCCGAYRQDGKIANFSSGGREIDWACPGQDIISFATNGSGYRSMSGTSMATPFGSGLLACIVEVARRQGSPQWTAAEAVRAFFKENLLDAGQPGWDPRFGHGIPVADQLLQKLIRSDLVWS